MRGNFRRVIVFQSYDSFNSTTRPAPLAMKIHHEKGAYFFGGLLLG
jgi:hypothetical protein